MFPIPDLCLDPLMINSRIFSAKVMKEVLEDMLVMSIGPLRHVVAAEVLVREVDSFSVHSRNYNNGISRGAKYL